MCGIGPRAGGTALTLHHKEQIVNPLASTDEESDEAEAQENQEMLNENGVDADTLENQTAGRLQKFVEAVQQDHPHFLGKFGSGAAQQSVKGLLLKAVPGKAASDKRKEWIDKVTSKEMSNTLFVLMRQHFDIVSLVDT